MASRFDPVITHLFSLSLFLLDAL